MNTPIQSTETWRPIESAPLDGTLILITILSERGEIVQVDVGSWEHDPGMNSPNGYEPEYWYWENDLGIEEPTHWTPLPLWPVTTPST